MNSSSCALFSGLADSNTSTELLHNQKGVRRPDAVYLCASVCVFVCFCVLHAQVPHHDSSVPLAEPISSHNLVSKVTVVSVAPSRQRMVLVGKSHSLTVCVCVCMFHRLYVIKNYKKCNYKKEKKKILFPLIPMHQLF